MAPFVLAHPFLSWIAVGGWLGIVFFLLWMQDIVPIMAALCAIAIGAGWLFQFRTCLEAGLMGMTVMGSTTIIMGMIWLWKRLWGSDGTRRRSRA